MKTKCLLIIVSSLFFASTVHATLVIDVGDYTLLPNTPNQLVNVSVSSTPTDSDITGMNIRAEIGDGLGVLAEPKFQGLLGSLEGISISGSIFDVVGSSVSGAAPAAASVGQFANAGVIVPVNVDPNGFLISLIIDTTGFSIPGEVFPLRLGSFVTSGIFDTELLGPIGNALPLSGVVINNGSITIVSVPESSPVLLLLLITGILTVVSRRRALAIG